MGIGEVLFNLGLPKKREKEIGKRNKLDLISASWKNIKLGKQQVLQILKKDPMVQCVGEAWHVSKCLSYYSDKLVIEISADCDLLELERLLKTYHLNYNSKLARNRTHLVSSMEKIGLDLFEIADHLSTEKCIIQVYPSSHIEPTFFSVDPTESTYLMHWHHTASNLKAAWQKMRDISSGPIGSASDKTYGDATIIVAAIDEFWTVPHPALNTINPQINNIDLLGKVSNGLSKIERFYDFVTNRSDFDFGSAQSSIHGMATAGIIAAQVNNDPLENGLAEGVVGAAPNIRLALVNCPSLAADYPSFLKWIAGLSQIPLQAPLATQIITNSYGFSPNGISLAEQAAILATVHLNTVYGREGRGQVMFYASGNGEYGHLPNQLSPTVHGAHNTATESETIFAKSHEIINVGAYTLGTDGLTKRGTNYSCYGPQIDIVGPSNGPEFDSQYVAYNSWAIPTTGVPGGGNMPGGAAICGTVLSEPVQILDDFLVLENTSGFSAGQNIIIDFPGSPSFTFIRILQIQGSRFLLLDGTISVNIPANKQVTAVADEFGAGSAYIVANASIGDMTITVDSVLGFESGQQILLGSPPSSGATSNHEILTISINGISVQNSQLTFINPLTQNYTIGSLTKNVYVIGLTLKRTLTVASAVGVPVPNQQFQSQNLKIGNTALMIISDPPKAILLTPANNQNHQGGENIETLRVISIVDHETIEVELTKHPHSIGTLVSFGPANYMSIFGGTSAACPFVAGIGALILSANSKLTWIEVRHILRSTAKKFDDNTPGFQVPNVPLRPLGIGRWKDKSGLELVDLNPPHARNPLAGPANHSEWYGYGAVDAFGAVEAAWIYRHDERDLMIRDHLGDNGTVNTHVPTNPVHSPDIWVKRNGTPYVNLPAFDKDAPNEGPKKGQDNYIFARIKNRGTRYSSLDAYVRFYIALHDGSISQPPTVQDPVIQTPFRFPFDWDEEFTSSAIPTNGGVNTVYYLGEMPLLEDEILPTLGAFNATDASAKLVKIQWNAADQPLANINRKTFLLVQVSPHDGERNGVGAERNSNLSYREILFAEWGFEKPTGGVLENNIEVDDLGTEVITGFKVLLEIEIGNIEAEDSYIEIERLDVSGNIIDEGTIYWENGNWVVKNRSGVVCGWITFANPVVTGGAIPATGTQTKITFEGTFKSSRQFKKVILRGNVKSSLHNIKTPISREEHEIILTELAQLPIPYVSTPPPLYPRSFVFADMANLTQSAGMGFGPISTDIFRITSSFTAVANTNAYAVVDGTVFVQEGANANLVNMVLKPLNQGIGGLTPVKYIVYRGLMRSDFIDGTNAALVVPHNTTTNSKWIAWLWGIHEDLNGVGVAFKSKALGFDSLNQASGTVLEQYFFNPDPDYQLPPALKGMALGHFSTVANEAGIDFVLEEGFFEPDLNYVRAASHAVDLTGITDAFQRKAMREQILNFLDPAAYYGLHVREHGYAQKNVSGNVVKIQPEDIYNEVLTPFLSKNTLYVDVRNEIGNSYNFFGHHPSSGTGDNIEIGIATGSLLAQEYQSSDWPLLIRSNTGAPIVNVDALNQVYLKVRTGHNTKPILYVEHGDIVNPDLLQKECFVEGDALYLTTNTHTEELGFTHPNVLAVGGGPDDKLNVAWLIKLQLGLQENGANWASIPQALPTENLYDNRFGPLEVADFWSTGLDQVRWVATQARKFIDGSTRNFGYASDRGVVFEGEVSAGPNPGRVLFFANAVAAFKSADEFVRSKGMTGGYSKLPSFFQEMLVSKKLNLEFDMVNDVGTDVRTLRLAPVDTSSPQPESMLFVGLGKDEYQTLKTLGASLSPHYPTMLKLLNVAITSNFKKFQVVLQGYDSTGAAQVAYPTTDIHVYTTDDLLCFSSAFSAAEPLPVSYTRTFEEGQGIIQKRSTLDFSIREVAVGNKILIGGNIVDLISPKDNLMIEGSLIGNTGGPYAIVSRKFDVTTKHTILELATTSLVNTSTADGRIKLPVRNIEDHFVAFDNLGLLSGIPEMVDLIAGFEADLLAIPNNANAQVAIEAAISDKPAKALQRARLIAKQNNYANADDRILYWTRIKMAVLLKSHRYLLNTPGGTGQSEVLALFESVTRGYDSIDFSTAPSGAKRILIAGFDLNSLTLFRLRNNSSAAVALALHGTTHVDGATSVFIQSVVFPNRYADFDGKNDLGVIETAFKKCIDGNDPQHTIDLAPDMVITLGEGYAGDFMIDRFACKSRGGFSDNNNIGSPLVLPSIRLKEASDFFETSLDPAKFKRLLNQGFLPLEDLKTRTTIQQIEFSLYYNNIFNYTAGQGPAFGYYNEIEYKDIVKDGQGFESLPDGIGKVELIGDLRLQGPVPTQHPNPQNIRSKYGSAGHYFPNEAFYRTAWLRGEFNATLQTGHLTVPRLMSPDGGDQRGYPSPMHLDLESLQHLIERTTEIILDGNKP